MASKVDVLAVMEREARCLAYHQPRESQELMRASKAVAELIAAVTRVTTSFSALGEANGVEQNIIWKRECERSMTGLADALAAVQP